ncbi:MAG: ATP-binding protein [Ktedonobacteraceae bacterium]|nr:ATP-binding protein [Ktedonobacteraceae bacterium]
MPDTLLLDSLEVRGFRAFHDLQIPHLGVVNLIVGKNNVGKSSLLEALRLYAENGSPALIRELLVARQESKRATLRSRESVSRGFEDEEDPIQAIKYLFYNRPSLAGSVDPIIIGPVNSINRSISISIEMKWKPEGDIVQSELPLMPTVDRTGASPALVVEVGDYTTNHYFLEHTFKFNLRGDPSSIPQTFIAANGLDKQRIGNLWNRMTELNLEDEVLAALKIITPEVQRISLLVDQQGTREHTPVVKVDGVNRLIPLRNMGDGMVRMFGIALALVNARNGMLLIDEVENGIHYSVQADMWRLIFGAAQRFNIQVFATTHSLDCIRGFRKAALEDTQAEGVLIRLQRKREDITATVFDEDEVAIATRNGIEVR